MELLTNCFKYQRVLLSILVIVCCVSCQKDINDEQGMRDSIAKMERSNSNGNLKQTKTFSSDVVVRWLNMQLDMLRVPLPSGTGSQAAERAMAYCGIALYESVVPGMPSYQSLENQLTSFPTMPFTEPGKAYHWAASANAALADMCRRLFPTTSAGNKAAMDNLENSLLAIYSGEVDPETIERSVNFGKEVASRVFAWALTDGSANINPPYVPPVGPGLWEPTPPNFPAAVNPYMNQRRTMVSGVAQGTELESPPAYSIDPESPFYVMVNDVYVKSQNLTPSQIAMALYHRDAPGYPGGGHFVAVLSQVFSQASVKLDVASLVYVKAGIASYEAIKICFTNKYVFNLVRPITYIRNVMGHTSWSALFNTPGHPEFPSAHAVNGAAIAVMLTDELGKNFHFTLNTYDYLGLPPREYVSFSAMAKEMSDSRVFGGIHFQASCDKGLILGEKVASNILQNVKFQKD